MNIPAYQGADPSQPGQSQSVDMNLMPILAFAGDEVYGVAPIGMSYWWVNYDPNNPQLPVLPSGGIVKDFVTWNLGSTGIYGYQANNITIDGFVCLGDATMLAAGTGDTCGMQFQDYFVGGLTIQNCNIQDEGCGIDSPDTTGGTITIQNSYIACQIGFFDGLCGMCRKRPKSSRRVRSSSTTSSSCSRLRSRHSRRSTWTGSMPTSWRPAPVR